MARVNYTPEQSVMKMREIDVLITQGKSPKEEQRLFDQVHAECCQCKMARRNIAEATRRIRCWFNKEFKVEEPDLPPKS